MIKCEFTENQFQDLFDIVCAFKETLLSIGKIPIPKSYKRKLELLIVPIDNTINLLTSFKGGVNND